MASKSASTLLKVVKSYTASDVMEFTAEKKALDHNNERTFSRAGEEKKEPASSVIVIDSNMTPLEAATLLWENNV